MATFSYIWRVCCDIAWDVSIHIWYDNQVPYIAGAHKTTFGYMPNMSNYGIIFHTFYVFVTISQKRKS